MNNANEMFDEFTSNNCIKLNFIPQFIKSHSHTINQCEINRCFLFAFYYLPFIFGISLMYTIHVLLVKYVSSLLQMH